MGIQITPPNDPAKPRIVTLFNPISGKPLGTVKLPPRTENRSESKRQEK